MPLRNSRKIQPIRRNPEEQPLKISAASDLLEKYIVHMRTAGALSNTTHQCLRFLTTTAQLIIRLQVNLRKK